MKWIYYSVFGIKKVDTAKSHVLMQICASMLPGVLCPLCVLCVYCVGGDGSGQAAGHTPGTKHGIEVGTHGLSTSPQGHWPGEWFNRKQA